MIAGKRFSAKSIATLRRIAAMPRDVRDLHGGTLYVLAAHRAIDVKDGRAIITRIGVRQLRNLS
jgi:hypothetical protein